jgi:hypothetical protein
MTTIRKEEKPLFAYGTLMFPAVIKFVIGRSPEGQPAVLRGYRRLVVSGELFPALIAENKSDHSVEGVLYRSITAKEWKQLIAFEDDFYLLERVDVRCLGETIAAFAFVVPPSREFRISDKAWDPEEFRKTALERWLSPKEH